VDQLPLTSVGKPLKTVLRQDIVERTFREVLAEATGLSCESGEIGIKVELHATRGILVAITVEASDKSAREQQGARISETMNGYPFAYTVAWR
jgi:hypothetical protein